MTDMRIPSALRSRRAAAVLAAVAASAILVGACASGGASQWKSDDAGGSAPAGSAQPATERPVPEEPALLPEDAALLARLRIAEEDDGGVDYVRRDYDGGGWGDADGDGCSTREEVLIAEAIRLRGVTKSCGPVDGAWLSWFDGRTLTDAREVEIDHLVPLAEAHRSGAAGWTAADKAAFADDLTNPHSLAAVSARSNRDKGASDPSAWRPPADAAWCRYARGWIEVKAGRNLSADRAEAAALREMLATCAEGAGGAPAERLDRPVPVIPYATCDEAEAAGLERRRGSRGSGRGFPADQIAYARDGDGDGIVCER